MRIAVTGAGGFVGWHVRVRLRALHPEHEVLPVGRAVLSDPVALRSVLRQVDAVIHLAGVNRGTPDAVEHGNVALAERLTDALDATGSAARVVYANSVHAGTDTPYGRGKRDAACRLRAWAERRGASFTDAVLPNLFGEGGRPDYHSFVATFCHRLATGGTPLVDVDRPVDLLHAQDAADLLITRLAAGDGPCTITPAGHPTSVQEVLDRLEGFATAYVCGDIPARHDPFDRQLFNTYRSFCYPRVFPASLAGNTDPRGSFVEAVRSHGGSGQTSYSTTAPGITRGNHFHLHKIERFIVLRGQARIAIRPVEDRQVRTFDVDGARPSYVDMPTLHTHSITNTGDTELLTMFWADEVFDPGNTDTYAEPVAGGDAREEPAA